MSLRSLTSNITKDHSPRSGWPAGGRSAPKGTLPTLKILDNEYVDNVNPDMSIGKYLISSIWYHSSTVPQGCEVICLEIVYLIDGLIDFPQHNTLSDSANAWVWQVTWDPRCEWMIFWQCQLKKWWKRQDTNLHPKNGTAVYECTCKIAPPNLLSNFLQEFPVQFPCAWEIVMDHQVKEWSPLHMRG